jgi:AcrR family transcriptional regulator
MNDIASASDKGRRTIYTYFKSKREIFNAVIKSESEHLLDKLNVIVNMPISPEEKLRQYVNCRFETMAEVVTRNGSLRAGFFRDVIKVNRARKIISRQEISMIERMLREGREQGVFQIDDIGRRAIIITHAINGLDIPYIRDNLSEAGISKEILKSYLCDLILNGVKNQ